MPDISKLSPIPNHYGQPGSNHQNGPVSSSPVRKIFPKSKNRTSFEGNKQNLSDFIVTRKKNKKDKVCFKIKSLKLVQKISKKNQKNFKKI